MVQRGQHPLGMRPRQIGYPLSFRGQVRGTQSSLPCFSSMGLRARRPPFLQRVPVSPVPRLPRYYEAATTSRRAWPSAYDFSSGFRVILGVRARLRAPGRRQVGDQAWSIVPPALRIRLHSHGHKRDLSGSLVTPPVPLPCSQIPAEPVILAMAAFPMLPPRPTRRRLRRFHDFAAATGLQYPLSTLHERRCRRPCKTRFRLAGSAFAGRASNPLGHDERFQVTSILLSRTCPDASWAHRRRQWFDIAKSPPAPIAAEVLKRVAELYQIEAEICGRSADERQHQSLGYRTPRQTHEAECPWICGRQQLAQ